MTESGTFVQKINQTLPEFYPTTPLEHFYLPLCYPAVINPDNKNIFLVPGLPFLVPRALVCFQRQVVQTNSGYFGCPTVFVLKLPETNLKNNDNNLKT